MTPTSPPSSFSKVVYFNDTWGEERACSLSLRDRGFLLGDGLFETLLALRGNPLFFALHDKRLRKTASFLKIPVPLSSEKLYEVLKKILKKNGLEEAILRITLTRGVPLEDSSFRGLLPSDSMTPTLLVTAEEYRPIKKPIKLIVSSLKRDGSQPAFKTLSSYLPSILERMRAQEEGFDECLFLNQKEELMGLLVRMSS